MSVDKLLSVVAVHLRYRLERTTAMALTNRDYKANVNFYDIKDTLTPNPSVSMHKLYQNSADRIIKADCHHFFFRAQTMTTVPRA